MNYDLPRDILPGDAHAQGWTRVAVTKADSDRPYDEIVEMRDWIGSRIGYNNWTEWYGTFWFKKAEDATMFKLRWS